MKNLLPSAALKISLDQTKYILEFTVSQPRLKDLLAALLLENLPTDMLPISKFLELRSYNTSDGQPYKFYYIFNQS
jgi:hypothetical protein